MDINNDLWELSRIIFSYPAIDNHDHAILREEYRDACPLEGLISEAQGHAPLLRDSVHTLACYREARSSIPYEQLCRTCMEPTIVQCILLDHGLGGAGKDKVYEYEWHDRVTYSPTKRIVRVETVAERAMDKQIAESRNFTPGDLFKCFVRKFNGFLKASAADPEVVGFKSIACYRTGLDRAIMTMLLHINNFIVNMTMRTSAEREKPGLPVGDNDITLNLSSPSHLQPLCEAYPNTKVVLLHSSYLYIQEAGYLTAVYENVFLDFCEVFPFVSPDGQREILRQVLELAPTNKITMWSTRQALFEVRESSIRKWGLTLPQAVGIVKHAFCENPNRIYNLGLEPRVQQ
ncbi:hypothetical protein C8T65DRAFT_708002 [Cerioporus squamosus]|nr:hypothetical protein C8T65DRAFT_708002 [Cerioporus squamosus]